MMKRNKKFKNKKSSSEKSLNLGPKNKFERAILGFLKASRPGGTKAAVKDENNSSILLLLWQSSFPWIVMATMSN